MSTRLVATCRKQEKGSIFLESERAFSSILELSFYIDKLDFSTILCINKNIFFCKTQPQHQKLIHEEFPPLKCKILCTSKTDIMLFYKYVALDHHFSYCQDVYVINALKVDYMC